MICRAHPPRPWGYLHELPPGACGSAPSTSCRSLRMSFRVGIGVDAHALEDGVPLVLGGVELVHPRGLQATPTATCSRTR